ncbi:MAG: phosphoenolpyruvate carboxykinase (GTP), partial [Planctomycetes bacterium]|nr:phosphoenolpyruvate carboxykinase (GTP) [Planctomycetota bacterium]
GSGDEIPSEGYNHCGKWNEGMVGPDGKGTTPSHKNARYTVRIKDLENRDPDWDKAEGLPLGGIIYGGRDSDTSVPVREAYSWEHGVCTMGATLESETTAATIGAEGVRKWNVMSNMDFLSMSVGRYINNNLEFAKDIKRPKIFGTNYFIKKDGKFLNGKLDKGVWLKWMDLRINNEVEALDAAYGMIPKYEDIKALFKQVLNKDYSEADYVEQFTIRIPEMLAKHDRMDEIYATVGDTPEAMKKELSEQRARLEKLKAEKGEYISPLDL